LKDTRLIVDAPEKDKRIAELESRIAVLENELKSTTGATSGNDIERIRTKAALQESKERYRELVENANSIILRTDREGHIVYANEYALRFFGYTGAELVGRNVMGTIIPLRDTAGKDLAAMLDDLWRNPEEYRTNAHENMRKNGELVWVSWTNKAFYDDAGHLAGLLSIGNDITRLKRAEEALRESEANLAMAQSISHVGNYSLDIAADRASCSDEFYHILGLEPQDHFSFEQFLACLHPEDRERACRKAHGAWDKGTAYSIENRIVRPDGEVRVIYGEGNVIVDETGRAVRMFGIIQDVTERKRAEESLKLTQFAIDNFGDPAIWFSLGGSIVYVNDEACRSLGYSKEELLSMHIWDIDPDADYSQVKPLWDEMKRRSGFKKFERKHINRDGRVFPVDVTACYAKYGEKEYIISFDRDITERKQAENAVASDLRDTQILCDLSARLVAEGDGKVLFQEIMDAAMAIMHSDFASLQIHCPEPDGEGKLFLLAFRGFNPQAAKFWECVSVDSGSTCGIALRTGQRAIAHDVETCEFMANSDDREMYLQTGIRAVQTTPLYSRTGRLVGMLSTHWRKPHQPLEHELRFMDLLARQVADLIDRKRADKALQESEKKFRVLADTSKAAIYVYQNENLVYVNEAAERITGYSKVELLKMRFWDIVHPDQQEIVRERGLARQHDEPVLSPYEVRFITKGGEARWIELSAGPITYMGRPAAVATFFDITERKRAEEALMVRERQLVESQVLTDTGSWELDLATGKVVFSDNLLRIIQLPPGQHTYDEFTGRVHPEDRARRDAAVKDSVDKGKPYDIEYRIILPDKSLRHIHAIGRLTHDLLGKPVKFTATLQNITERKHVEDALREREADLAMAQRIARVGSYNLDIEVDRARCSDEFYRILGLEPQDHFSYNQFLTFVHTEDREAFNSKMQVAWDVGQMFKMELRIVRQDGEVRSIYVDGNMVVDDKDRTVRMFGVIQDITERKQAEETLKDAKARAELYLDLMGHDINNMNQSAIGFLELALQTLEMDGKIGRGGKLFIEKPLQAVHGSSRLISNVRKLQRLTDEGVKTMPVDLHDLFRELKAHDFDADDREATVNVCEVPHYLVEGTDLLRDVFINLISNAVKHSDPDRPVTIDVGVEHVDQDGRAYYRCTVEDNGPGVPDKLKSKLFHRFQRGKTQAHGKGLGLYLVRTLVEGYHGKVWVEDRVPGDHTKGAKFVVMLPAVEK
jgi:PAS domain S-box-containing protein